jgi:hypothetical protein
LPKNQYLQELQKAETSSVVHETLFNKMVLKLADDALVFKGYLFKVRLMMITFNELCQC